MKVFSNNVSPLGALSTELKSWKNFVYISETDIFKEKVHGKEATWLGAITGQANRADGLCNYCKGFTPPPSPLPSQPNESLYLPYHVVTHLELLLPINLSGANDVSIHGYRSNFLGSRSVPILLTKIGTSSVPFPLPRIKVHSVPDPFQFRFCTQKVPNLFHKAIMYC